MQNIPTESRGSAMSASNPTCACRLVLHETAAMSPEEEAVTAPVAETWQSVWPGKPCHQTGPPGNADGTSTLPAEGELLAKDEQIHDGFRDYTDFLKDAST